MSEPLTHEEYRWLIADLSPNKFSVLEAHDAALRAQLTACEQELPDTWYVDKPLGERLAMLITQWQKALRINTELEQQLAAAQATIAGYRNTVNIYTEQFTRLESRTARLREALEKIVTILERTACRM